MTKLSIRMLALASLAALWSALPLGTAACSTPEVRAERDAAVDVSRYKTYAWVSPANARDLKLTNPKTEYMSEYSSIVQWPDAEPKVKAAVDQRLRESGYSETPSQPDFYVTYYGKAKNEDWVSTWSGRTPSVWNVPLVMYPDYSRELARNYSEGTLILVFYDARTKRPVWTGNMPDALKGRQVDLNSVIADLGRLALEFKSAA